VLLALVIAAIVHRFRHVFLRGIPDLSADAVGILRVVFGFVLFGLLDRLALPDAVGGPGSPREAVLWEPWGWVEYLAAHWDVRDALHVATYVAVCAFTVGAFTRIA